MIKDTRHPECRRQPAKGFTLVELLVVIGIIALLISILLPALSKARDAATKAVCLSNQKQIMLGILMYCGDNKGLLPGPCVNAVFDPAITNVVPNSPMSGGTQVSWLTYWYGSTYYDNKVLSEMVLVQKYLGGVGSSKVWFCPASDAIKNATNQGQDATGAQGKQLQYGYRINNDSYLTSVSPPFLFGDYRNGTSTTRVFKTGSNPDGSTVTYPTWTTQPERITSIKVRYGSANLFVSDPSKTWIVSDLDGRNYSSDTGAANTNEYGSNTFGICNEPSTSVGHAALEDKFPFQPVHRVNSLTPTGLGRNYAFLDGHAEFLPYKAWPGS